VENLAFTLHPDLEDSPAQQNFVNSSFLVGVIFSPVNERHDPQHAQNALQNPQHARNELHNPQHVWSHSQGIETDTPSTSIDVIFLAIYPAETLAPP
jgi:hypothetical protein